MAQVDIRGRFLHMPGPWGMARPAARVSFTVVDRDVGNSDDIIFTSTANANGEFAGTTRDWRDTRSVTVNTGGGTYTSTVADASDVMALRLEVRQQIGNRSYSASLPYVPPAPGFPTPQIVLPWGPPGRTQVRIDGAVKRNLNDCIQTLQAIFAYSGTHEIVILGEGIAQLRQRLDATDVAIKSLLATINAQLIRDRRGAGTSIVRPAGIPGNKAAGASQAVRPGTSATSQAPSANDPWEAIRQQILALVRSMEQSANTAVTNCAVAEQVSTAILMRIAPIIVATFIAAASTFLVFGSITASAIAAGAIVTALVVTAIVTAIATIIANLPAILNGLAAVLDSVGAHDAANQFRSTSHYTSTSIVDTEWFGSLVMLICMACAIFMLMLAAPADGWAWIVETVGGADGVLGLRFLFSR
jgi:hypothetical protein